MKNKIAHMEGLGVESAFVYDFASRGSLFTADAVYCGMGTNTEEEARSSLFLAGEAAFDRLPEIEEGTAVCIAENQTVAAVCRAEGGKWQGETGPVSVCAILVIRRQEEGNSEDPAELALRVFHKGDSVRFLRGGDYVRLSELLALAHRERGEEGPLLYMENSEYATVGTEGYRLRGRLSDMQAGREYSLHVTVSDGRRERTRTEYPIAPDGSIAAEIPLEEGANYIACTVRENGKALEEKSGHIVFRKKAGKSPKQLIMWAEQYVNADVTNSVEKIERLTARAKQAGITAFALDLKGVEGYCSYKKATRTHVKYMTCTVNPGKQITMEIDFLEEFIKAAHRLGLKVYGSFNFFVEGNIAAGDYAIRLPDTHPEWAEVLHAPEDGGKLQSVLTTKKNSVLCYVNPGNREVWEFEVERVREVLDHYEVDGIIMDRTRYDNQYADFSELTRGMFERSLAGQGKTLENWPEDIYRFAEDGSMVFGKYYLEWLTFRSGIIREFALYLREIIQEYREKEHREIALAAYVGSWYDLYYQNGVNWASKEFCCHDMLKFPLQELYTQEYGKTSYLEAIDFLMIGCYYDTRELVEKYATLGNLVTNNEIPIIASLSLPDLQGEESLCAAVGACLDYSDGLMVFDLCYTNWEELSNAIGAAEGTGRHQD